MDIFNPAAPKKTDTLDFSGDVKITSDYDFTRDVYGAQAQDRLNRPKRIPVSFPETDVRIYRAVRLHVAVIGMMAAFTIGVVSGMLIERHWTNANAETLSNPNQN